MEEYDLNLSDEARQFFNDMLDRNDRESFYKSTEALQRIRKNPGVDIKIYTAMDDGLLDALSEYTGRKLDAAGYTDKFPNFFVAPGWLWVMIGDAEINMYGPHIQEFSFDDMKADHIEGDLVFLSISYGRKYQAHFKGTFSGREYVVDSEAISLNFPNPE